MRAGSPSGLLRSWASRKPARKCLEIEIAPHGGRPERGAVPTFANFVAGPAQTRLNRCKPSTQKGVRLVLNGLLLPAFGPMPLDRIGRIAVTRWFDEYSSDRAGRGQSCVERAPPDPEPCDRLRPSRHQPHARHQAQPPKPGSPASSRAMKSIVSTAYWTRYAGARPSRAQQADIIRLLLLTGCRKSEIVTMRWQDVDADARSTWPTPRPDRGQVFLNAPARAILERQPQSNNPWVFSIAARSGPTAVLRLAALVRGAQAGRD